MNHDTCKRLLRQYRGDCEGRIASLSGEYEANGGGDTELYEYEYRPQIEHWQATIREIDAALAGLP